MGRGRNGEDGGRQRPRQGMMVQIRVRPRIALLLAPLTDSRGIYPEVGESFILGLGDRTGWMRRFSTRHALFAGVPPR